MRITGIDVAKRCEVIRRPEFAPTDGVFAMSIDKRLTALGRKQLFAERSKWKAFARAMGLILDPSGQEGS